MIRRRSMRGLMAACALVVAGFAARGADSIVMVNGVRVSGRILAESDDGVTIDARGMTITVPTRRVGYVVRSGRRRDVNPVGRARARPAPANRAEVKPVAEPARARPAYETETWPKTRTLVWAKPGESGDLGTASNWLESGRPASRAPDRETDVVLPASEKSYRVKAARKHVRHVTVEKGGMIIGGHRAETEIWGNLWVKPGGRAYFISIRGPRHTFFRIDDAELPNETNKVKYGHTGQGGGSMKNRTQISHKFQVCKYGDASVEFIGKFGVSDEIMVQHGRMIINGDLRWSGVTGKGALEIYNGACVELQSGSTIGPLQGTNRRGLFNVVLYPGGRLSGGSKDRPLQSDAHVMLGFGDGSWGKTGLFASEGSTVEVFSEDPKKARLVFTSITSRAEYCDGKGRRIGNPGKGAGGSNGVVLHFMGPAPLDGVAFDYVGNGGILLKDPSAQRSWKNVTVGGHCAGGIGSLVKAASRTSLAGNQGYDSKPLTRTALKGMDAYLKKHDPYKISSSPDAAKLKDDKGIKEATPIAYRGSVDVTLSSKLAGAEIRYTTDGSTPDESSAAYRGPITLSKTTTIRVRAYRRGMPPSPYFTVTYTVE